MIWWGGYFSIGITFGFGCSGLGDTLIWVGLGISVVTWVVVFWGLLFCVLYSFAWVIDVGDLGWFG